MGVSHATMPQVSWHPSVESGSPHRCNFRCPPVETQHRFISPDRLVRFRVQHQQQVLTQNGPRTCPCMLSPNLSWSKKHHHLTFEIHNSMECRACMCVCVCVCVCVCRTSSFSSCQVFYALWKWIMAYLEYQIIAMKIRLVKRGVGPENRMIWPHPSDHLQGSSDRMDLSTPFHPLDFVTWLLDCFFVNAPKLFCLLSGRALWQQSHVPLPIDFAVESRMKARPSFKNNSKMRQRSVTTST